MKNAPIDSNRIKKYAKEIIISSEEDRKLALALAEEFKQKSESMPADIEGAGEVIIGYENLRVECLKLAQTSKTAVTKILSELIKLEAINSKLNPKEELDFSNLEDED